MWLCLNNAFLSVVDKANKPGCLMVRARRRGDIEKAFPGADVLVDRGTDYRYRAEIPRDDVASVLSELIKGIDYPNFKDSVSDDRLHAAYSKMWGVMYGLQKK